jgi:hypothetical protein
MNFGTTVTTSDYTDIQVVIDPDFMMKDYAEAVSHDLSRRNPIRYAAVESQAKALFSDAEMYTSGKAPENVDFQGALNAYLVDLARLRIQMINDDCKMWREAKQLAMPAYVQFAISMIGIVRDVDHGRRFVPYMEKSDLTLTVKGLYKVTDLLRAFESDGVVLLFDAFPRLKTGDQDTMSYAIIDSYVKAIDKTSSPAKSYIAVFLGMKLKQESNLKCLYSVRYDNVDYVKDMLIQELSKW